MTIRLKLVSIGFAENLILKANPSKTGGDWWYGTVVRDGKSGFFPNTYVEPVEIGECPLDFYCIRLI